MRKRTATPTQRLLDRSQGEDITGVPARTIYDWMVRGDLPVVRFPGSRKLWFERVDLERLIEQSKGQLTA